MFDHLPRYAVTLTFSDRDDETITFRMFGDDAAQRTAERMLIGGNAETATLERLY